MITIVVFRLYNSNTNMAVHWPLPLADPSVLLAQCHPSGHLPQLGQVVQASQVHQLARVDPLAQCQVDQRLPFVQVNLEDL